MILYINTNSKEEIKFFISDESGKILNSIIYKIDYKDSQKILTLLDDFLISSNLKISNVEYLVIVNGPGINMNFRIGIIMTNALAYSLNIPIATILSTEFSTDEDFVKLGSQKILDKNYSKIVLPEYSIKPN